MDILWCFPPRSDHQGIRGLLAGGVGFTGSSVSISGDVFVGLRARIAAIAGGKPNGRERKTGDVEKRWTVSRQNIRRMRVKLNALIECKKFENVHEMYGVYINVTCFVVYQKKQ